MTEKDIGEKEIASLVRFCKQVACIHGKWSEGYKFERRRVTGDRAIALIGNLLEYDCSMDPPICNLLYELTVDDELCDDDDFIRAQNPK